LKTLVLYIIYATTYIYSINGVTSGSIYQNCISCGKKTRYTRITSKSPTWEWHGNNYLSILYFQSYKKFIFYNLKMFIIIFLH